MTGQTVWITGARGFIGQALVRARSEAGDRVHGLGHGDARLPPGTGLSGWTGGDLDRRTLDAALTQSGSPAVIYHLAGGASVRVAEIDPEGDHRRTVEASTALLDWAAGNAPEAALVIISSAAVYGEAAPGRIAETAPLKPISAYGRHKAKVEDLARTHAARSGGRVAIARLFSVYGPGLRKQLLWDISRRLADGPEALTLSGSGGELRDWTAVDDVCAALPLLAAAASPEAPVVNVGHGVGVPVHDIASMMLAAWESPARLTFSGERPPGDPFSLVADPARLAALGFRCRISAPEGVAAYAGWSRVVLKVGSSGTPQ